MIDIPKVQELALLFIWEDDDQKLYTHISKKSEVPLG